MQEPLELSFELFPSALLHYTDSAGWSPKAWTTTLSKIHLCTHLPSNCRLVPLTSSLQLGVWDAHFASGMFFAWVTHPFLVSHVIFRCLSFFLCNVTSLSQFAQHIKCVRKGKGRRCIKRKWLFFTFI